VASESTEGVRYFVEQRFAGRFKISGAAGAMGRRRTLLKSRPFRHFATQNGIHSANLHPRPGSFFPARTPWHREDALVHHHYPLALRIDLLDPEMLRSLSAGRSA